MTDKELKELKDTLWHSADVLRASAHLAANKYGQPILGLIFLRYADILYKQHKEEIEAEYNRLKGGRMEKSIKEISIEKCGFYLPECAYYDVINDAPDDANKATIVKKAMEAIEDENPKMDGVLPKEVYAQLVPEEEPELLSNIVRIFKDIPENSTIDIFGEIYEYFLGNFAFSEGKDGGTFYTPATVVRYMVEVLNPQPGEKKFLDPACGSGGMFVQAARYMHNHNASESEQMKFRCYGVEKEPDTVKLAKMNLLLNNVRGDITEANSFYSDPYNAFGQFDYVMANPPFNVDEVVVDKVSDDARFNTYGVPRNKSKSTKKKSDKKETVPNANYLWIGYFATALNEHGKAALVMANSASDASGSEYDALLEEQANYWNAKFPLLIDDSGITHKAKSALISWFEENIPMSFNEDSDIEAELEKYYSASLKTYKDTFLRCMRSYQDASSIDLGLIDNAYGNLDFIISNHSIRKYAYNNIFDKMRKFVYQFREEAYHFDLLNDGKGNFAVCVSKVVDLNKLFFAAKDVKAHGYVNTLVYQTAFDEIESELEKFRCKIYKTKYVPVKSSPISGMMRYFGEDSETKGTDE